VDACSLADLLIGAIGILVPLAEPEQQLHYEDLFVNMMGTTHLVGLDSEEDHVLLRLCLQATVP
jgi:hypothetical protein